MDTYNASIHVNLCIYITTYVYIIFSYISQCLGACPNLLFFSKHQQHLWPNAMPYLELKILQIL